MKLNMQDNTFDENRKLCPFMNFMNFPKFDDFTCAYIGAFTGGTYALATMNQHDKLAPCMWVLGGLVGFLGGMLQYNFPLIIPSMFSSLVLGQIGGKYFGR